MTDEVVFHPPRLRRRRAFLWRLSPGGVIVIAAVLAAGGLLVVVSRGWGSELAPGLLLAGVLVLALLLYVLLWIPTDPDSVSVLRAMADWVRSGRSRRRRWGSWTPTAALPVPRAVGEIAVLGVAQRDGDAEQAIVRHSPIDDTARATRRRLPRAVFTTTLEIGGRGDGQRHPSDLAEDAARLEMLLSRIAQTHMPIDEVQVTVRAMPGLPRGYREQLLGSVSPQLSGSLLGDNTEDLADIAATVSDQYRTFVTMAMPTTQLRRAMGPTVRATRELLAAEAHTQAGRVAQLFTAAGFDVVGGLGPRRLGALMRHLYAPSWGVDDLTDIGSALDGFQPHDTVEDALAVVDSTHDVTWYHATAQVPATMWPASITGTQWMRGFVTDMVPDEEPSVVRAVTTSYRLVTPAEARRRTQSEILADATSSIAESHRITDGAADQQASSGFNRMQELADGAAGALVSTRVLVTSPSLDGLWHARQQVDEAAASMAVDWLRWADDRPADAMVWSLPLCRGIVRRPPATSRMAEMLDGAQ